MSRVPKKWSEASYLDPEYVLIGMRRLELSLPLESLPYPVATLRTNLLKPEREMLQGALFCYGMGQRLGVKVMFSRIEDQDFDIVATYQLNGQQCFVPIQLKELVPDDMPVKYKPCSLQEEIAKLDEYVDSKGLVIAFYVNRRMSLQLDQLSLSTGRFGQLWLFGAADIFTLQWFLIGDLLSPEPIKTEFNYPGFNPTPFNGYTIRFGQ